MLIDALAVIMGHKEKELCKPGNLAMDLILDIARSITGSKERVCTDGHMVCVILSPWQPGHGIALTFSVW